ncbi:MAG: peptidoglycan DD-metalloendopeptidase family protein [Oscillatoriales cyanobacterium RM1_1_9]|nr:peptidoglycan DD-metalloendopeptidase family protein [Oscillatoriales cyanobacterium RM1_1_9]
MPDARSEISGAMVIEPELTDTPISIVHQVRVGETLAQIAASHNLSIEELTLANRLADPNLIEVNQKLKVPQGQGEVASSPKVARAKLSESVDFQTGSFEPQGKIALDQLAQISKSEKSAEDSQSQVFEADSESILSSRVEAYQPMTLASSQEQVESDASGVQAATNNIYTNRLRAEVDRLREEYRAQKLDQLVPIADSNGTPSSNREDLNPAVDVTVQPLHRINPEFNLEAYSQQKLAAADKGHPPKSFSEFTQSSTEGTKVALAADQFPVRSDSEPPVVATAPLGSSAYDPLKNPALGLIVSPDLPPMLGPDAYLPGSSPQFNGYIWPSKGVLTSGYGWRWGRMHKGIDIAGPIGTPVVAAAPGLITYAGWNDGGYGYLVEIEHGDGSLTLYAHNDRIVVNKGQKVAQGQHISDMGSTGRSTGPHLHFEIHPKGKDAVNPMAMLPRNSDSAQAY